jgi:outer membrane protein assembly factor BamA
LAQALPVSATFIQNTTFQLDARKYLKIGSDALLAARFFGFASRGKTPYIFYYGGNNEIRTLYYYSQIGNEGWYANLEFRFPVFNSATTPIGQIGPIRGTLFLDMGRAKLKGWPSQMFRYDEGNPFAPLVAFDAVGSYGFGFQFFFLGFPIHLDFVKRFEISDMSNPFQFNNLNGLDIGKLRAKLWIGFDF